MTTSTKPNIWVARLFIAAPTVIVYVLQEAGFHVQILAATIASMFAIFILGVPYVFKTPSGTALKWTLFKVWAVIAMLISSLTVLFHPQIPFHLFILSLVISLGSGLLFFNAADVGRGHLNLAFVDATSESVLTEGPYAYVRHPFYTSYLLNYFAAWVAVPTLTTLLVLLVMCLCYMAAASQEERLMMSSDLAPAYGPYMQRTGRFLPKLTLPRAQ